MGVGVSGSRIVELDSGAALGLTKGWDIYSGVYVGAGMDYTLGSNDLNTNASVSTSVFSLKPEVTLGYQFNPYVEINGGIGYDLPFYSSVEKSTGDTSESLDLSANNAFAFFIALSYHLDFAGPFSDMFQQDRSQCSAYR